MENKTDKLLEQIKLLGVKSFVNNQREVTETSKEDYLQTGICTSLAALLFAPKFDIVLVSYIAVVLGLSLVIYFILENYNRLLNKLEEKELDGSELGI